MAQGLRLTPWVRMETVCLPWLLRHQHDEALPAGQEEDFSALVGIAY